MSPSWLPTASALSYLTLTLITTAFVCLSCAFLIVQAIRSSSSRSIEGNWNVVIIGAAYTLVVRFSSPIESHGCEVTWRYDVGQLFATMGYCVRRRVAIRRKLQKISKVYKPLGKGDVPDVRYHYLLSVGVESLLTS